VAEGVLLCVGQGGPRRAFDVSQFQSAAQWMRIALEQGRKLDPSPYDLARIVVDYLNYGELNETYEARIEAVREATDRLMALPDRSVEERKIVADLCQSHGYLMYSSTQAAPDDAKAMMRRGLDILEGIGPCAERARVLHRLGWIGWRAGPIQEAEAPLRQALAEARACGDDRIERWAMHDLGIVLTFLSSEPSVRRQSRHDSEGLRLLEQSMDLARASSDVFLLTRCYINVPATLWTFGRLDGAIAMCEEGLEYARRSDDRDSQFWIGNNLAEFYADRGELLRAAPLHEEMVATARSIGRGAAGGLHTYALTLLALGRFEEARSAWISAGALEDVPEPQAHSRATHLDAVFRWSDDPSAATRRLRAGLAEAREIANVEHYQVALLLARMGVRMGDTDATQEGSALVHELAASSTNPVLDAVAAWAAGLSEVDVDPAAGGRAVAKAAAALEATGRPVLAADAFTDAALLGERAGLANALTWSTHARELYERCSAVPVLEALHGATP
jgi:tetratricopeptide (TPR) repeat protein